MMLMDLPLRVSPNLMLIMKNFFARMLIHNQLDRTFSMKTFSEGARQALIVVSQLMARDQFDDLPGFVSREVNI